jgi:hypothetical protein
MIDHDFAGCARAVQIINHDHSSIMINFPEVAFGH